MEGSIAPFVQFSCVDLIEEISDSLPNDLLEKLGEAKTFLRSFRWVSTIDQAYLGDHVEGIIGIFLFKITPKLVGVDDYVWVIVGDLPNAYITVDDCPNPAAALDGYIGALEDWVSAVLNGEPTDELIPVDASESRENALALKSRLKFLDERILPDCKGSLEVDLRE